MVKNKISFDNLLDTSYQKNAITRDSKIKLTPLMDQVLLVYMAHQKLIKHELVFQNTYQTYLRLAFQHIKLQNIYTLKDSFEFASVIDKQDYNSFIWSFDIDSLFTSFYKFSNFNGSYYKQLDGFATPA